MDYRADWSQESNVLCKCAAFSSMDNAVLFNNIDGGINCVRSTWTWRGFDGGANYYLCRRNLVGFHVLCHISKFALPRAHK